MTFPRRGIEDWKDLGLQLAHLHQTASSSVVASWEVLAAELHRALVHREGVDADVMVSRLSDALVPTLSPLQDAERDTRARWGPALEQARQQDRLAPAFGPATGRLARLAEEVPEGWLKTVDYLQPLFEALEAPELSDRMAALGRTLGEAFAERELQLRAGLAEAVVQPAPYPAVLAAIDQQRMGLQEDLELALGRASSLVMERARA